MSAERILTLLSPEPASDSEDWRIVADRHLCLGAPHAKHMSGGCCVASIIAALEAQTGQPLIQASAQFLRAPAVGDAAMICTTILQAGRSIVQARADMTVDGTLAVSVQASLGARETTGDYQWTTEPLVPGPEACTRLVFIREDAGDLHTHLDIRAASPASTSSNGRMVFWVRAPKPPGAISSAFLALVADYVPEAIHACIGRPAGAVSLDNSIRFTGAEPTDWLLCETQLATIAAGLCHGQMSIFAQSGRLLALTSQTAVVRPL